MNIFLIGYRGSGKTTVGRLLAERLGLIFVDLDQELCRCFANPSIAEIWRIHGEPAFRKAEVEAAAEYAGGDGRVLALGGGTIMQPAARQAIVKAPHALRVYLHCDPAELHRRIQGDPQSTQTRPNLTHLGGGLAEIQAVLAQREPIYRAVADRVVDVTGLSPQQAAEEILRLADDRKSG